MPSDKLFIHLYYSIIDCFMNCQILRKLIEGHIKIIGIMKEYVISEEIITRREFNQIIFNLRRKV